MQKRKIIRLALVSTLSIICAAGFYFYNYQHEYHPYTDNAYLTGHISMINAQISGPVKKLYVTDNEIVKKQQLLLEIESKPFELMLDKAATELQIIQQEYQHNQQEKKIKQSLLYQAQAEYNLLEKKYQRLAKLFQSGAVASETFDEAKTKLAIAQNQILKAENQIQQENFNSGALQAKMANAKVKLQQAEYDLQQTKIYAPIDGQIAQFKLRKGDFVRQGQPLAALIEDNEYWIDANFKEVQLKYIKVGNAAEIKLDMYPDITIAGVVASISKGSGAVFSILPVENAVGNWVKVIQRYTVKIKLLPNQNLPNLRIGASASVTINTQDTDYVKKS